MPLALLDIPKEINKKLLGQAAKEAFLFLGNKPQVSLKFVPVEEISRLNEVYRKKKGPTDVLSFEDDFGGGDIVINIEKALEDANSWNLTLDETVCRLLVHGILHLSGYDHQKTTERAKMEEIESQILSNAGISYGNRN